MASFVQMWKGSWDVLGLWGVSGQSLSDRFVKPAWPVSPACVRLSPTEAVWLVSETGLTGLGCQQPCRVCFRCVCVVAVGWVLLLGSLALQWLRELGKRSLRRCTSEIGFIGRILEYYFCRRPFTPPLSGLTFRSFNILWKNIIHSKNRTWLILNLDFILIINFEKVVWIVGKQFVIRDKI
jgi:hypothetical protein